MSSPARSNQSQECHICLEDLQRNLMACPCGHVYHQPCIRQALHVNKSCPICRRRVSEHQLLSLYFDVPTTSPTTGHHSPKGFASPTRGFRSAEVHCSSKYVQSYEQKEHIAQLSDRVNLLVDRLHRQKNQNDQLVEELETVRSRMGDLLEQKQHLSHQMLVLESSRGELQTKITKYQLELNRQAEALRRVSVNRSIVNFLNSCDVEQLEEEVQNPRELIVALKKSSKYRHEQFQKVIAEKNQLKQLLQEAQQERYSKPTSYRSVEGPLGQSHSSGKYMATKGKTKAFHPPVNQSHGYDRDQHRSPHSPSRESKRRRLCETTGYEHVNSIGSPFPGEEMYRPTAYSDLSTRPMELPRQGLGRSAFNPSQYGSYNVKPSSKAPVEAPSSGLCRRGYDETGKLTSFFTPREPGRLPMHGSHPHPKPGFLPGSRPTFPGSSTSHTYQSTPSPSIGHHQPSHRREYALTAWLHKDN